MDTTPGRAAGMPVRSKRWLPLARILALIFVIAISIFIYSIRDQADQLSIYGYPGIFLLSFLAYATVLLPAPGVAVVFTMGAVFNPVGVALAAGAGAALGEISGYLAGFSGSAVIERADLYHKLSGWMTKNGPLTVLLLSAVPNPFFDLAGVAAGAVHMPLPRFLFWAWIGETLKMFLFAAAGASSFDIFTK
jgi:membrane protein YqaA with SNARE-associated domain